MANKIILEVDNLTKYFNTPGGLLHAVDGISFKLEEGKTLGVVGESGCGKSTTGRTILKLLQPTSGKIIFDGEDITSYGMKKMRRLRQEMQMILIRLMRLNWQHWTFPTARKMWKRRLKHQRLNFQMASAL